MSFNIVLNALLQLTAGDVGRQINYRPFAITTIRTYGLQLFQTSSILYVNLGPLFLYGYNNFLDLRFHVVAIPTILFRQN